MASDKGKPVVTEAAEEEVDAPGGIESSQAALVINTRTAPRPVKYTAAAPAEVVEHAPSMVQITAMKQSFRGPLPSPWSCKQYEQLVPGMTGQLLENHLANEAHMRNLQASEVEHRRKLEVQDAEVDHEVRRSEVWSSKVGLVIGGAVGIGGLVLAGLIGGYAGAVIAGVDLVSLASVFVVGTRIRRAGAESGDQPVREKAADEERAASAPEEAGMPPKLKPSNGE